MNILLVSHATLSKGVLEAFRMFAPDVDGVCALGLTAEGGVDAFRDELARTVGELAEDGDLLIMADLQGGTPFNESVPLVLQNPERMRLVTGLNLPMLVEAGMLMAAGGDLDAVYRAALTTGAEGVMGVDPTE